MSQKGCRTYNPNQIQQFTQIPEPELPEFLYHLDEEEDPIPSFAMTNPYEALITHDPARQCVRVTPNNGSLITT